jgi:hypothetical protein
MLMTLEKRDRGTAAERVDRKSGLGATFVILERQQQAGAVLTLGKGGGAGHV